MLLNREFQKLLQCLNREKVKYLIVGAYAVMFYAEPRFTQDIDIWVKADRTNAHKILRALKHFGLPVEDITVDDLTNPELMYQIGKEPCRIDILLGIEGVTFEESWKNRKSAGLKENRVSFIGLNELIKNKKKSKRLQDIIDLKKLRYVAR
ncbi:MAG TPA: nucleotidyltransferase [bacterium]|nr:nucleotidyltransferase [bacterium]